MPSNLSRMLDLSNPRYWRQNAQMAIRDVYDAIIELVTNADDRYVHLEQQGLLKHKGRIEIEVERRRREAPSVVRVRDFADGMTIDVMENKLAKVGHRVSGMADGVPVRGAYSRGAKDIAWLGGVTFESVAGDLRYHRCEISARGFFTPQKPSSMAEEDHRTALGIPEGTGTVVTLLVEASAARVPRHDKMKEDLSRLLAIRDILCSPNRVVILRDPNREGREDVIAFTHLHGEKKVSERFTVPGYGGAEAKLVIRRSRGRLQDRRPKFRDGGILVKSKHAIHEATLFDAELERDPHAEWFFGRLTCPYIDALLNEYDERLEAGSPTIASNPLPVVDPVRRAGLDRGHPFTKALFAEALKRLRPLVEKERRREENTRARIESEKTRKRLRALERAATRFMTEHMEERETSKDPNDAARDSVFREQGYSIQPPFTQLLLGHSKLFWLNVNREAFPEFSAGDTVQIVCATSEISATPRVCSLEAHPGHESTLQCRWKVKGEKATKATAVRACIGQISAESTLEVLAEEKDKYAHVAELCFDRKQYSVRAGGRRRIMLLAPCPSLISEPTRVTLECSDGSFTVSGPRVLTPKLHLGVAVCTLHASTKQQDRQATLKATAMGQERSAKLISSAPAGASIKIELKDKDLGNQRYQWQGNVIVIAARHPSLRRYLGPPDSFPGQEEKHFRVLLAEIVADAVSNRILATRAEENPEEYADADWDAYYADYSKLMTQFLPAAHGTQVPSP